MASNFVLFVILLLSEHTSFAVMNKNVAVSMIWNHVGSGCFEYDFYTRVAAKNKEECLQQCLDDIRCAFVAYDKPKHECALCNGGYKHNISCPFNVELIAKDINECAIRADNCKENAVCINTPGKFECRCRTGYYKKSGQNCIQVPDVEWIRYEDSCLESISSFTVIEVPHVGDCKLKCQINDHCSMVEYRPYNKKCRMARHRKFKPIPSCRSRSDIFVKAIIECDNKEKRCPQYAYCHAKEGNRLCRCRFGYKGNGKICNDVNECTTYSNLCGQYAKCHNTIGSFKCICLPGYHGDGQICRKDKLKNKDITTSEKSEKGAFHTIVNLFNHSESPQMFGSSRCLNFLALLTGFILRQS